MKLIQLGPEQAVAADCVSAVRVMPTCPGRGTVLMVNSKGNIKLSLPFPTHDEAVRAGIDFIAKVNDEITRSTRPIPNGVETPSEVLGKFTTQRYAPRTK